MSKHYRTAGVGYRPVVIAGQEYKIRPLTIGVYAAMEAFIVAQRPDPLEIASEAVKKLPPAQHDAIWRAAMNHAVAARTVTAEEAAAFENSVDGLAWKLWHCLKENHPEIDGVEAAKGLLIKAGEEHFEMLARSVELGSGEADLGKSSGQAEGQEADLAGQSSTDS
jgi:hypothetical protein